MSSLKQQPQEGTQTSPESSAKEKKFFGAFSQRWNELGLKKQRAVYTWLGILLSAGVVLYLAIPLFETSSKPANLNGYETHNYDLGKMPFTTDEAEKYLVDTKYQDMQEPVTDGIYSQEERAQRQREDEQAAVYQREYMRQQALAQQQAQADKLNPQVEGYQPAGAVGPSVTGGTSAARAKTKIEKMASANLAPAKGTGVGGLFGPSGNVSSSKDKTKKDENNDFGADEHGAADAKEALFRMATGSRAAAGLAGDKETNARKALAGGSVTGREAFIADSEGINLDSLDGQGLGLDPNAIQGGANAEGLDERIQAAIHKSKDQKEKKKTEKEKWMDMIRDAVKNAFAQVFSVIQEEMTRTAEEWATDIYGNKTPAPSRQAPVP